MGRWQLNHHKNRYLITMVNSKIDVIKETINAIHANIEREENTLILRAIFRKYNHMLCLDDLQNCFHNLKIINKEQRLYAKAIQFLPINSSKMTVIEFDIRDINYENN